MKKIIVLAILLGFSTMNYGQPPNLLSKEEKIYGLSKFWQEVNYNFVYFNKIDRKAWDSLYVKNIGEVQETKNDYEYYKLLQRFAAFLKDGHTNIWFPKMIADSIFHQSFGDYKFQVSNIDGKAIITEINNSKKKELPIGTEILAVNDQPTKVFLKEYVMPYWAASTQHALEDVSIKFLFQGYVGTTFKILFKLPNGTFKTRKLTLKKSKGVKMFPPKNNDLFEFRWIQKDIAYMALNSFISWDIMEPFMERLPEIRKAQKLIIDLRKNTGGNEAIGREMIKFLIKDTILYGSRSLTRQHIATYKAWGQGLKAQDTSKNKWSKQNYMAATDRLYYDLPYYPYNTASMEIKRIAIPTVLLIGHATGSAAEDFLIYAANQEHITTIGEPTNGSTGQPYYFELPGQGMGRVCTKKDLYPDGREFVGIGVIPDIEAKITVKDFLLQKDVVIEKAVQYLNEN